MDQSARSVLSIFDGASARVLESEHKLCSLMLGLDAQRILSEHQGTTKLHKMGRTPAQLAWLSLTQLGLAQLV